MVLGSGRQQRGRKALREEIEARSKEHEAMKEEHEELKEELEAMRKKTAETTEAIDDPFVASDEQTRLYPTREAFFNRTYRLPRPNLPMSFPSSSSPGPTTQVPHRYFSPNPDFDPLNTPRPVPPFSQPNPHMSLSSTPVSTLFGPLRYFTPPPNFSPRTTPRPPAPRSRSSLRAQASPYVPASQRLLQRSSSLDSSYHTAQTSQSFAPPMLSQDEMAAAINPHTGTTMVDSQTLRAIEESTAHEPVAGASSSHRMVPDAMSAFKPLMFETVPALNPWKSVPPNPSFNPPSSLWASKVELGTPRTIVASATPDVSKACTSTVNTPKKAVPTPIIVTPPRGSSKTQSEGHPGAKSPNWRSRVRSADRSRSPLAQRSETSNMPVPVLHRHTSRSPRRSTIQKSDQASPKPSVKHLTCWWFHEKGQCRYSDEECLYAHHETGMVADAPRQIQPGGPALAGKGLERALRRIASETGSLKSNRSSPPRSRTPSEAEFAASATDLQNNNIRTENAGLRHENEILRKGLKELYVSTSSMLNSSSAYRRSVEVANRQVQHIILSATNTYSQPLTDIVVLSAQRHLHQQRLQLHNHFHEITDVMVELEPRTKDCGAAEWGARANMTKVVLDIEKAHIGWDLAAAVAQDGVMEATADTNNRPVDLSRVRGNNLSDVLENMRLGCNN